MARPGGDRRVRATALVLLRGTAAGACGAALTAQAPARMRESTRPIFGPERPGTAAEEPRATTGAPGAGRGGR